MEQVKKEIENRYGGRFVIGTISMQGIVMEDDEPDEVFLKKIPKLMLDGFEINVDTPASWEDWSLLFHKSRGLFNRPVLMFMDEFDSLPAKVIDKWATLFRDMYINQKNYVLQGLCLIGVRAAVGVEGSRGMPFNVRKSLHVPNLTRDEVREIFRQYQKESQQEVTPEVVMSVFDVTRGHPGLVCWFGELLTENYQPGHDKIIDQGVWNRVYRRACDVEWNNMFLNLIKMTKKKYRPQMLEIFARSDIPFKLDADWCNHLYLNGIIDAERYVDERGEELEVCRFSCPFVQKRLYKTLTDDIVGNFTPVLALNPFDELEDVSERAGTEFSCPDLPLQRLCHPAEVKRIYPLERAVPEIRFTVKRVRWIFPFVFMASQCCRQTMPDQPRVSHRQRQNCAAFEMRG